MLTNSFSSKSWILFFFGSNKRPPIRGPSCILTINKKIMYLKYRSCPNIVFVVWQLSCHNFDLRIRHLCITKEVFCWFKGTIRLEIVWGNNFVGHQSENKYELLEVVGYTNSNYVGDLEDKKSITKYYFFTNETIVT